MVIDTSIILCIYFNEHHAEWALRTLDKATGLLCMSTVNLSECLILIRDRNPKGYQQLSERLLIEPINYLPPTRSQAVLAAEARHKFPLNLGDCFAYALAKEQKEPLITLDRDFKRADISVILP